MLLPSRTSLRPARLALALAALVLALGLAASSASAADFALENRATHNVLSVSGAWTGDNTGVVDWPYHGGAHQRWRAEAPVVVGGLHYSRLVATHSNKCLDIRGGVAYFGMPLVQNTCTGSLSQQWRIEHVGGWQTNAYFRLIPRAAAGTSLVAVVSAWNPGPGQELVLAFKGDANSSRQHFYLNSP